MNMKSFGWPTYPLEEICEINIGKTPSRNRTAYWGGQNKWLSISDMDGARYIHATKEGITDLGAVESNCKLVPAETVLLSFKLSIGKVAITSEPIYTNEAIASLPIIDTNRLNRDYLYWVLQGIDLIQGSDRAVMGKTLNKAKLKALQIPLPPIEEQRRIAAILDKADAIRRKQEKVLALADDFLRATFLDMFGDPVTNSKHLETVPIKEFGRIITGNTPSRAIPEYYGDEIEWIKSDNINTPLHYLTTAEEGLTNSGKAMGRIAMPGSVLVTCIAGSFNCIGNAAIANREVCFNQQINAIEPFQNFDTEFLYAQVLVGKKLIQGASTNSMKGMVSKGKFQEISFIRPPEKERIRFSEFFNTYMKMNNQINDRYEVTKIMYEAVLQRAFRGEL